MAYQPGGYGDLTEVPGCPDRLAFAHTGDNLGPPSADEVVAAFAALRARVPGAEVRASTLDAFAEALPTGARRPPGGDPGDRRHLDPRRRLGPAEGRGVPRAAPPAPLLARGRRWWRPTTPGSASFHEDLLLVAEHTWGLDEKTHLPDRERWSRADLPALRAEPATQAYEASWAEQRAYVEAAAGGHRQRGPAPERPGRPSRAARPATSMEHRARAAGRYAGADRVLGPVRRSHDRGGDPPGRPGLRPGPGRRRPPDLALLAHQSFSEADYRRYWDGYVHSTPEDDWWAIEDTTKPGIDAAGATSSWWEPEAATVHLGERWSARAGSAT